MSILEKIADKNFSPWFNRLVSLFESMDGEYDRVAKAYNFNCTGCADNCCFTRFYHHTLIEYLYLRNGFDSFDITKQEEILVKARKVVKDTDDADLKGEPVRFMCPLNLDGLCVLYEYRPMVCRLHGMAHELRKPGQEMLRSSGCDLFKGLTENTEYLKFDRTPFYIEMAKLEGELRNAVGFTERMKHTIAGMLLI